jgi:glyoxylase-like metal-dependent hydrolase (beta-lactamase superfamily II)
LAYPEKNMQIIRIDLVSVNCYLIKLEHGFILIDAGNPGDRLKIDCELEKAGCLPGDLKLIIITHGDGDHTGSASYICHKYKSIIAMHRDDSIMAEDFEEKMKRLKRRKSRGIIFRIMWKIIMLKSFRKSEFQKSKKEFEGFIPSLYLEDSRDLDSYGFKATVLGIPGHTKGSLGILTAEGDLFCGDILYNYKKPAVWPQGEDLIALDSSVGRIKELNIGMVYPGHGKPFEMKMLK